MRFSIIPVTAYQQNCSLLICDQSRKAAVVDPGGDLDLILSRVNQENVELESILVTHGHFDHIGAVAELAARLSLPIYGPQIEDEFWIKALPEQCRTFGFPPGQVFVPNRWLSNGDIVKVGNEQLQVFHCPGHTPGHIIFFNDKAHLAIVGDVLFKGSIGRTDFPKGDFETLIASIRNKLWSLGDETAFIPGHGPMSTIGEEKHNNPFVGTAALQQI